MSSIRAFWWKVLEAVSTIGGLSLLLFAHRVLEWVLDFSLHGGWTKYHQWLEGVTFCVFYAVYFFLLVEVLILFWPVWLKRRPGVASAASVADAAAD